MHNAAFNDEAICVVTMIKVDERRNKVATITCKVEAVRWSMKQ